MITIHCRTNLDLHQAECWPKELPAIPRVGDLIESGYIHKVGSTFRLRLQVCRVTWECSPIGTWTPVIELHMTDTQKRMPGKNVGTASGSITAFYKWYALKVGKDVGNFI